MVKSPIFQMRWLSKFKSILSRSHLETLIHASCLDYFNCLLIGISQARQVPSLVDFKTSWLLPSVSCYLSCTLALCMYLYHTQVHTIIS